MKPDLTSEFIRLRAAHQEATKWAVARTVLSPSVMRVFAARTRERLIPVFAAFPIDDLRRLEDEAQYRAWFERQLESLTGILRERNEGNPRVQPGLQWGHAAKLLCILVAAFVLWSRYFPDDEVVRISPWLFVPIDGVVMARLASAGLKLGFSQIREIDTPDKFYGVQDALGVAASHAGVPRIWFDDAWARATC